MAEGILRGKASARKLSVEVDSCGFESFHVGDRPDNRAMKVAAENGIDISKHRARLFRASDFMDFDHIYVMERSHYHQVLRIARDNTDRMKVDYILNVVYPGQNREVDDPWYHELAAFKEVYRQLDLACEELVKRIELNNHGSR